MLRPKTPASAGYQLFVLTLCIYALAAIAIQSAVRLEPRVAHVLKFADYVVCLIFFVDFLISLWKAENRWHYLATWGWLDLLSSIPTIDIARWGRLARVLRVFRVLRALRAARLLSVAIFRQRAQNGFLAASLVAILLVIFCSVAILYFENDAKSNIRTGEDAIWWAISTITTIGYGDRYPVTLEGRMVASVLMLAGVGLFSVFSGFLASWFIAPENAVEQSELAALRADVASLRQLIEQGQYPAAGPPVDDQTPAP
jgi:voltage-gated potassium channel